MQKYRNLPDNIIVSIKYNVLKIIKVVYVEQNNYRLT